MRKTEEKSMKQNTFDVHRSLTVSIELITNSVRLVWENLAIGFCKRIFVAMHYCEYRTDITRILGVTSLFDRFDSS